MGGRTSQSTNTLYKLGWAGHSSMGFPVNWREGLDNRMSSAKGVSRWLIMASANLYLKKTFGAGNLQSSGPVRHYESIFCSVSFQSCSLNLRNM